MTSGVAGRAAARFAGLRRTALATLDDGSLHAQLLDPPPPPSGWCGSVLARLDLQAAAAAAHRRVDEVLRLVPGADVWPYPRWSRHLSALALTGREPTPAGFTAEREARLAGIAAGALDGIGPIEVRLGGLALVGTQLFVEVVPLDHGLATLRGRLGIGAEAAGEAPLIHADPEPVHLNVARLVGPRVDLVALRAALAGAPPEPVGLTVGAVELVVTDFVVSPGPTRVVGRWDLAPGG